MEWITYASPVVGLGALVAMFLMSFRNGKASSLATIQEQTITALQTQLDALKDELDSVKRENAVQAHTLALITSALKARGDVVTIDGDMVTIVGPSGTTTAAKKPAAVTHLTARRQAKTTQAVTRPPESETDA